jgi:hypothetical protein
MAKGQTTNPPLIISKQSFSKAKLGQSFAEHDLIRTNSRLFVETPAIRAAQDLDGGKTFFIGRRGTGKTAITFYLKYKFPKNTKTLVICRRFCVIRMG